MSLQRHYFLPDGTRVYEGVQFDLQGFTYPAQWITHASDADLAEHNITLELVEVPELEPEPEPVVEVTDLQARLALEKAGVLHAVETVVKATGGPVAVWWDRALTIRRDSPFIAQLAPIVGLDDAQLDALFEDAARY